jgi:hypothetical protein
MLTNNGIIEVLLFFSGVINNKIKLIILCFLSFSFCFCSFFFFFSYCCERNVCMRVLLFFFRHYCPFSYSLFKRCLCVEKKRVMHFHIFSHFKNNTHAACQYEARCLFFFFYFHSFSIIPIDGQIK